ncbi:hypothetical protein BU14_0497s0008 [Porphyra umbilicalis]|uniref:Helicase C-terminal domain-containing protein n=1 Tax=Porphyra umbilicalis TaxID=2786 RepID=A0A1X6NTA7_PORUM|nr:hypothetical protein BU14_0497s0008 [Porphyra umbilicalis]|eukprot:OSX71844.1 hypothetical protein BU14_0497s0008 [Porphyra umbilicalis]
MAALTLDGRGGGGATPCAPADGGANAKLAVLVALLTRLRGRGHRTLVFSASRTLLDVVAAALAAVGITDVARLDGRTPPAARSAVVAAFNGHGGGGGAPPRR